MGFVNVNSLVTSAIEVFSEVDISRDLILFLNTSALNVRVYALANFGALLYSLWDD